MMTVQSHRRRRLFPFTDVGFVCKTIFLCVGVDLLNKSRYHEVDALIYPSRHSSNHPPKLYMHSSNTAGVSNEGPKYSIRKDQRGIAPKLNSSPTKEPWSADYCTSLRTQRKIQSAASDNKYSNLVEGAQVVLQTLLNSPPSDCNAANLVCALTLTAKLFGSKRRGTKRTFTAEFQHRLKKTLDILQMLVDGKRMSPRQLCNASWAIAKHVEYDESIYPRNAGKFVYVKSDGNHYSKWDMRKKKMHDIEERIAELLDSISLNMMNNLQRGRGQVKQEGEGKSVRPGELSMLLWAYAFIMPRVSPPGWGKPRRVEEISTPAKESANSKGYHESDFIAFIAVDEGKSDKEKCASKYSESEIHCRNITTRLFDAAAVALCLGEGAAVSETSGQNGATLLRNCSWNELSTIAWSFATIGSSGTKVSEAMMTFLAREASRRLKLATSVATGNTQNKDIVPVLPRDVTQIAWALGTMESDKPSLSVGSELFYLIDAINDYWVLGSNTTDQKSSRLKSWKCADLTQLASALAHARLDNQPVLTAIYKESLERLGKSADESYHQFSTSEISVLVWVQARLHLTRQFGHVFADFPGTACRKILHLMTKDNEFNDDQLVPLASMRAIGLNAQEQANLAWAITVLEHYDKEVVRVLQNVFYAASNQRDRVQLEHAHQLWQSFFILSEDCPDAVKFVPEEFSEYLKQKWNNEKDRSKQSSSRHKAISKTLNLMRVSHRNEFDDDVDVAIVLEEKSAFTHMAKDNLDESKAHVKVAVEFDGPHHFTVMTSLRSDSSKSGAVVVPRVLGHTVLKYRMLKKKGWTVVRIPFYEFDKIPHWASMERQRYLQRCLKTHKEIRFSGIDVSEYQSIPPTRQSRFD